MEESIQIDFRTCKNILNIFKSLSFLVSDNVDFFPGGIIL